MADEIAIRRKQIGAGIAIVYDLLSMESWDILAVPIADGGRGHCSRDLEDVDFL